MPPIIEVRELSKLYQLGQFGARSLRDSVGRWWDTLRGRPHRVQHDEASHPEIDPERAGPVPNSFWALKDVSFDVEQGEVLGIIGRNGAGKSTLLKILSRITEPTHGYAKLRGRVASLLEVGTGFHDELTGRENVYLNGTILGLKKREIDQRLDEIVDFSGVEKFLDTPVKRYSSGMRVRLAFAVAAHLDPEILIIDEVLAVGDAEFQKRCYDRIQLLSDNAKTVICVSHNMHAVRQLASKVIWLAQGSVFANGTASSVVGNYQLASMDGSSNRGLELPDAPSAGTGFISWSLSGSSLANPHVCYTQESVRIAVKFKVERTIECAHLGFQMFDGDSLMILCLHSLDDGRLPLKIAPGNYEVCWDVVMAIRPGVYQLRFGLAEAYPQPEMLHEWNPVQLLTLLSNKSNSPGNQFEAILNLPHKFSLNHQK